MAEIDQAHLATEPFLQKKCSLRGLGSALVLSSLLPSLETRMKIKTVSFCLQVTAL